MPVAVRGAKRTAIELPNGNGAAKLFGSRDCGQPTQVGSIGAPLEYLGDGVSVEKVRHLPRARSATGSASPHGRYLSHECLGALPSSGQPSQSGFRACRAQALQLGQLARRHESCHGLAVTGDQNGVPMFSGADVVGETSLCFGCRNDLLRSRGRGGRVVAPAQVVRMIRNIPARCRL